MEMAKKLAMMVLTIAAMSACANATMLINEDFSGTAGDAFDTTGWTTWALGNRWYTDSSLAENTEKILSLKYSTNGTMGHAGSTANPAAMGIVNAQAFSGTDTVITFRSTHDVYECGAIIFNYQDKDNYYIFGARSMDTGINSVSASGALFRKVVDGTPTTIATFENPQWDAYGEFKGVNPDGVTVTVAVDGSDFEFSISRADKTTLTYTASDATFASGGQAGFILQSKVNHNVADLFTVVPEPATMLLLAGGAMGVLIHRKGR
ncbi:MAG: PEP-CTERM sorting domain-containing protein [Phycisphaerae bacterium]|nr:PEP-CTERM sorting domain-containing protein [Phycisphaerae bacterium]